MAQLENLLVTGSSRFLQKVYFADDISIDGKVDSNGLTVGDKIQLLPNQASFNVPVTVSSNFTVSGGTVTADRINSKSVYVADVLNATRYEISTIQSLGGIVDVCPSFKTSSSATVTVTSVSSSINVGYNFDGITSVSLTGYYRVAIKDTKQITSSNICGSTWTRYSKVKITGTLAGNSCNSIDAYLLYDLNSNTAGTITLIIPKTSFSISGSVSNMSCPDVDIILVDIYKSINGGTSKRRPVGMYLSSYNGSVGTGISIYDGNVDSPSLLLGDLSNSTLPTINNLTPQGWGLYATNAYLQGIIVSESGKIGGFSIDSNSLTNGSIGTAGSVSMSTGSTATTDIAGSGTKSGWAFTAGNSFGVTNNGKLYSSSGKIGGWTITDKSLYYKTKNMDSQEKYGVYLGTDGILNNGSYGCVQIHDGHIELGHLIINYSDDIALFGFKSNPNSGDSFYIDYDGLARFTKLLITRGNIIIPEGKSLRVGSILGVDERQLIGLSDGNNVVIGYGTYANKETSATLICAGDRIQFHLGKQNAIWKPYYTAGDSIRFNGITTTGYITNNKTELRFSLSLERPVVGATKATIQTITSGGVSYMGVCVRQGGKYLYGSSATDYAQPSICNVGIMNGCLNFLMKFGGTENVVTNNDTCGVVAKFEIYLE